MGRGRTDDWERVDVLLSPQLQVSLEGGHVPAAESISRKRGSLEGESQDALTLSSVFPSATKSLCDLSHVISSPGTSSSLPPKHAFCLFISTQTPKICWNSFLPCFAPTDPNTSGSLHQSEHRCSKTQSSSLSNALKNVRIKMYALTPIHSLHLLLPFPLWGIMRQNISHGMGSLLFSPQQTHLAPAH